MVSIVIPARNESENIESCLRSVLQQNYPPELFEILLMDDHSTDDTPDKVLALAKESAAKIRLFRLSELIPAGSTQSFKKKAIEIAIEKAQGELILTTDADCLVPKDWLNLMVSFFQKKQPKFIAAPVNFYKEKNTLERFQSLDFIGMMGITGAGIEGDFMRMCNGANLAYPKSVFYEVNGFGGIDHLASGDDMLLMQKVAAQFPNDIGYLKNQAATVLTEAKPTLSDFFNQRIRWASKSSSYQEWKVTLTLAMVFFFCCNIVLAGFASVLFFIIGTINLASILGLIFIGQLLAKALMDYVFLRKMAIFFKRETLISSFLPSFFLHIFYIVTVGFLANFKKRYEWKGRKVT